MTEVRPIFKENTLSRKTGSWRDPEMKQKPRYLTGEESFSACKNACPLKNEIPQWISLLKDGRDREAWEKLIEKNPFPAITGRVCQAFCEQGCNRKEFDEAVSIRSLEKFLGDKALSQGWHLVSPENGFNKFFVAVIGSGPCGLSCAYQLARKGYNARVYEDFSVPGGMLRVGIPDFRLPKDILEKEIKNIFSLGVKLVGIGFKIRPSMIRNMEWAHDAVFFATGLQKSRKLGIPGEEKNPNILYGLDFLKNVNLGKSPILGKTVIVIGGGNTAIDAARTARKMGSNVVIAYRRTKADMPAIKSEVEEAEKEGIEIIEQVLPAGICWKIIQFQKTEQGEPDKAGRRNFIPIEGKNLHTDFDNLIIAAGEEKEEFLGMADEGKVFISHDSGNVPAAINFGRLAAENIDCYLRTGQRKKIIETRPEIIGSDKINTAYFSRQKRKKNHHLEAKRCFSCGLCRECENCFNFCPEPAVKKTGNREQPYAINYDYCKGCGICAKECPRGAIVMEEEKELKDES